MMPLAARVLLLSTALVVCSSVFAQQQGGSLPAKVVLGTNNPSAYSAEQTANHVDNSAALVSCVFEQLPYQVELRVKPWRRVQQDMLSGTADGFFTAMSDPSIGQHATLSDPLVLEKWYWFSLAGASQNIQPNNKRIGAILGSQQQLWYELNGYSDALLVQDLPQLIKLMFAGRIDVILADRENFMTALSSLEIKDSQYQAQFFRYVPLGVYIGQHFIVKHPKFLARFNRKIPLCVPEGFSLDAHEQRVIRQRIAPFVERWLTAPELLQALAKYNAQRLKLTEQQVQKNDRAWREAYQLGNADALNNLLAPALMSKLTQWQAEDKRGYLTEIIITDKRGLNLAVAPYTTDYWQGDEAKFQQGIIQSPGQWYFDRVMFDSSTHHFQVQLSLPIRLEGVAEGVMTLGIDIERVLHDLQEQH